LREANREKRSLKARKGGIEKKRKKEGCQRPYGPYARKQKKPRKLKILTWSTDKDVRRNGSGARLIEQGGTWIRRGSKKKTKGK